MEPLKIASFCAGIGGFEEGIRRASRSKGIPVEFVFASEIDEHAQLIYSKHFGDGHLHGDIKKIEAENSPDFDIAVGGFPCQAFSHNGRRGGFDDDRGKIFFHIARFIEEKKPKMLFFENVPGLLSHDGGNTFRTILSALDGLGYDVEWQICNSKVLTPQNRRRVYIIGHYREGSIRPIFPLREEDFMVAGTDTGKGIIEEIPVHNLLPRSSTSGKGGTGQLSRYDGITYCLDTGNSMAIEVDGKYRYLTPIERERLQGFDDNWTEGVSTTQRNKQTGNAVNVHMIQVIAEKILN